MLSASSAEECPPQTTVESLHKALTFWFEGFEKQSMWQVRKGENRTSKLLVCLTEPITTQAAFELHVLNGVTFWLNQSKTDSIESFSAAKHALPTGQLSERLFPKGHEIHLIFSKAPTAELYPPLVQNKAQTFIFNGHLTPERPKDLPTIFQVMEANKIASTSYLLPNEALPFKTSRWKKPVLYSSIGIGLLSLSLYTGAAIIKSDYQKLSTTNPTSGDREELQQLFNTNQTLFYSALATTGVSVGLTALAFRW